jgi:predicted transcriptional regulator
MKKEAVSKTKILKSVAKMVSDKELVRSYIKGKTPIQTLTQKGIKLAKPF